MARREYIEAPLFERMKMLAGCGLFMMLLAGALGADDTTQIVFGVFGVVYGRMWLAH